MADKDEAVHVWPACDQQDYKVTVDLFDTSLTDETPMLCDNCGHEYALGQYAPIEDCNLTPGDPSPLCRCPECDALNYPPSVAIQREVWLDVLDGLREYAKTAEYYAKVDLAAGDEEGHKLKMATVNVMRARIKRAEKVGL